jgi:hypothetical protein
LADAERVAVREVEGVGDTIVVRVAVAVTVTVTVDTPDALLVTEGALEPVGLSVDDGLPESEAEPVPEIVGDCVDDAEGEPVLETDGDEVPVCVTVTVTVTVWVAVTVRDWLNEGETVRDDVPVVEVVGETLGETLGEGEGEPVRDGVCVGLLVLLPVGVWEAVRELVPVAEAVRELVPDRDTLTLPDGLTDGEVAFECDGERDGVAEGETHLFETLKVEPTDDHWPYFHW